MNTNSLLLKGQIDEVNLLCLYERLLFEDKLSFPTFVVYVNSRSIKILNLSFHPLASSIYILKRNSLERDYIRFVPVFTLQTRLAMKFNIP